MADFRDHDRRMWRNAENTNGTCVTHRGPLYGNRSACFSEQSMRGNEQTPQPTPLLNEPWQIGDINVSGNGRYSTTSRAHNERQLPRLVKDLMMTTQLWNAVTCGCFGFLVVDSFAEQNGESAPHPNLQLVLWNSLMYSSSARVLP